MDDSVEEYNSQESQKEENLSAPEKLRQAEDVVNLEKRKLIKQLEYVGENMEHRFSGEDLHDFEPLAPTDINQQLDETIEDAQYDEETLMKVVGLYREATFTDQHINAATERITEQNQDRYTQLNDRIGEIRDQFSDDLPIAEQDKLKAEEEQCFQQLDDIQSLFNYHNESMPILGNIREKSREYIEVYFGKAGEQAATNIVNSYREFKDSVLEDDSLKEEAARLAGIDPNHELFWNQYDTVQMAELVGGLTHVMALRSTKELRPDKLISVPDEISAIKLFTDSLDNGVWKVFDKTFEGSGFKPPKDYPPSMTRNWADLSRSSRLNEIVGNQTVAEYERVITESLLKNIVENKSNEKIYQALEPLRSPEALEVVLIQASKSGGAFTDTEYAIGLLSKWSQGEDWPQFLKEYQESRGVKSDLKYFVDEALKDPKHNDHLSGVALKVANAMAYQEGFTKGKIEYALKHMGTKDILKWGHHMGLVEDVDFDKGLVIAGVLHKTIADLVAEKYQKVGLRKYHKYERDITDIDYKIGQLIKYKGLILESELQDRDAPFLSDRRIIEKYVYNDEEYDKNAANLMEIVKEEGQFLRKYQDGIVKLLKSREELLSLEDLRLFKAIEANQDEHMFLATLATITSRKLDTYDGLLTPEGKLTPEFFNAIGTDTFKVFIRYVEANEDLSLEFWDAAFRARALDDVGLLSEYMAMKPELTSFIEKLKKESELPENIDIIGDQYWENNSLLVAYLHESGIKDFSFEEFRRVTQSRETPAFIRGQGTSGSVDRNLSQLIVLREQLGVDINNITVFDANIAGILESEVSDPKKANFYRRMLAEGKGSFRNLVTSIDKNNYDVSDKRLRREIEVAVRDLGNISPIILDIYVNANDLGRAELKVRIQKLGETIRKNEPILTGNESSRDIDLLAEQISIVFPGNEHGQIKALLVGGRLADKVEDLAEYKIRGDGYRAVITEKQKVAVLPDDQEIDKETIGRVSSFFVEQDVNSQELGKVIGDIFKRGNNISLNDVRESLPIILATLPDHQVLEEIRNNYYNLENASDVDAVLGKIEEATGIFFDDNIEEAVLQNFHNDEETVNRLQEVVSKGYASLELVAREIDDPAEQLQYLQDIGELIEGVDPNNKEQEMNNVQKIERIGNILKHQIRRKVIEGKGGLSEIIEGERGKLEYVETDNEIATELSLRGYVSKNAASFFAKGTAGICTAGDVELYMRDDHFHINLFDGDTAVGNIQVYKIEHNGKRALLFRGFNPSTKYVNKENSPRVTEGMISIVKQFAKENEITDVFLSEQLDSWHALTNRSSEGVLDYFQQRYLNPNYPGYERVEVDFPITSEKSIRAMYRISLK